MAIDTRNGAVFGFIAQHTGNSNRSTTFYNAVFGWAANEDDQEAVTFMKRKRSQTPEAVLFGTDDAGGVPVGQWIPHIAVDDIHTVASRCVEAGGSIVQEIHQVWADDPGLICRIRDPEGGILGLIQVARR